MLSEAQQQLLQDFETFLLNEQAQPIADEESTVDLFSLFREMAELKNEVKLESRQIKKTLDDYKELVGLLKTNNEVLSETLLQQQALQKRVKEQETKEVALALIRFCDYLNFSLESLQQSRKIGWFSRHLSSAKWIEKMLEGQNLLLSRFQLILNSIEVTPMRVTGTLFDSSTMFASEVCSQEDCPNGQVMAELQTGYFMGPAVLRLATVRVNKRNEERE